MTRLLTVRLKVTLGLLNGPWCSETLQVDTVQTCRWTETDDRQMDGQIDKLKEMYTDAHVQPSAALSLVWSQWTTEKI